MTFDDFNCFSYMFVMSSCLRDLFALRTNFLDAQRLFGLSSSLVRRWRRLCSRDAVEDEDVIDGSDLLLSPLSECM